ncbi:PACE efflux transporter [Palleronia sp. LCG004]|uniref:PACE efflux transporter n=1 Tax=Palleronia sp. LCG004 TaxID=3079304 RepID=UPI002942ED55|nr:PACE efflux transporter [Palleronia sp. LCG004]WOI55368.1 PACE efflux transporter [Palleronia sp. LCG004]
MRSTFDRIRQALLFEGIGILIVTPLFALIFDHGLDEMGVLVLVGATVAAGWNYAFNLGFDHALRRWRGDVRKTAGLRVLHAFLFETTLLIMLLPFIAWWLGIPLLAALAMDLLFAGFYMIYAFVFTWGYDAVFPPDGSGARA